MNTNQFNFLNQTIIKKLNKIGVGKISSYEKNEMTNLPIPDSFMTTLPETSIHDYQLSSQDISKIKALNCKISSIVKRIKKWMKPGVDIADIDKYLYQILCYYGIFPTMFGYDGFPKASSISVNSIICHAIPYHYILKDGDIVSLDLCGFANGFHTDIAQTYCIGKCSSDNIQLVKITEKCFYEAAALCKPGTPYSSIGKKIEEIAISNHFKVIDIFGGHGIGRELHMKPFITNKATSFDDSKMKEGDMFAIEPILCLGNGKTLKLPDNFGYITSDGSIASHFERVILITKNGYQILNK
jgi:methionyl aminopeptidase